MKSNSFTRICLRVNHYGLIFQGIQGAISMCRFRCFSISGKWIIILIILTLFHYFFFFMYPNNVDIITSLPVFLFYYSLTLFSTSFFMSFLISYLFYHLSLMPLIKFSLASTLPWALAMFIAKIFLSFRSTSFLSSISSYIFSYFCPCAKLSPIRVRLMAVD